MRYFMFIDESGEANVDNPDPRFNIFVLCGIIFREDDYHGFNESLKGVKTKYFSNDQIIFHSFEMRKKTGPYKIFQDAHLLQNFYDDIGEIFKNCSYKIISCAVDKVKYKARYPQKNFAYEDALTFICERAISYIGRDNKKDVLHLCLEKRDKKKDSQLKKCYTNFIKYGTQYYSTDEFKMCNPTLHFRGKGENINGLQLSDLCAYPIARKILSPATPQPTFDLFEDKFYCNYFGKYKGLGLKFFP